MTSAHWSHWHPAIAPDDGPAMTITEFSRRCGLSHKALRLYDLSGLLSPAERRGYRSYHPSQLDRARRIGLLRQLDMPLATVAEVLAGSDEEAAYRLEGWWTREEQAFAARRSVYGYLRTRLVRGVEDTAAYLVSARTTPAVKVATVTRVVDQSGLTDAMVDGEREIRAYLETAGGRAVAERWVVYHGFVTSDSEGSVEVCIPYAGTVDPSGDIVTRIEPAQTQAFCTVTRDDCWYPQILTAFETVQDWVARGRHVIAGPPREVYFARWDDIVGTDPFVHVAMPIHGEDR
jgi:DNA-binding transcriptional MerR regulator